MSAVAWPRYRFTAEEFYQMGRAGILPEDTRFELIDGEIVSMSPIGERHADCVDRLLTYFARRTDPRIRVRGQNPLTVAEKGALQPDVALVHARPGHYGITHPTGSDAVVVIEVADTTLLRDRDKLPKYAAAGVPEVWIVDLQQDQVEVYRERIAEGYRQTLVERSGSELTVLGCGVSISVSEILFGE
jgi:Uma2 family endonuclease